jgi:NADH:ubiquinone oxidoreductase subunit 4 (subunit M)
VDDITARERFVLVFLCAPLVLLGVLPSIMSPMLQVGFRPVLTLLGVAT